MSGTATSKVIVSDLFEAWIRFAAVKRAEKELSEEQPVVAEDRPLYIYHYSTEFKTPIAWLADVENRIRNSISPDVEGTETSCERLAPAAAQTALQFIRNACDLLPGEPHIYGTREGNLVAEFQTDLLRLTSVISGEGTILFGYRRDKDEMPRQAEIRAGSNRSRDELRSFNLLLGVDPHGEALEAAPQGAS